MTERRNTEIDHPRHYNKGKIEVIDFIEDQQLGFHLGNVIKYVCRATAKDGMEALKKVEWYLQREIQRIQYPELTSKQAQLREATEEKP